MAPNHFNSISRAPLWTRPFAVLMLQNLTFWVATNMFLTTLPGYVLSIGGTTAQTGILIGIFSYAALLFRPISGNLLDRWDRRQVLLAGTVLATVTSFFYPFLPFLLGLMLLRFLHGLGFSAFSTSSSTMAADIIPESRMSEGLGVFGLANTISMAVGPSLGLVLAQKGYPILFATVSGLMILCLVMIFWIDAPGKSQYHKSNVQPVPQSPRDMIRNMVEKSAFRPSLVAFILLVAIGAIISFLPLYGLERGFTNIGMFFTVYAIALVVARFLTGRLADEYGSNVIFIPSMLLAIASTVILAMARTENAMLLAAVLYGAGTGLAMPILSAILIRLAPPSRRGAANATYFASMDIAVGTGSVAMGVVSQNWGFTVFYLLATVIFALGLAVYLVLLGRLERQTLERTRIEYCDQVDPQAADPLD